MQKTPRFIVYAKRKRPIILNRSYRLKPSQRAKLKVDLKKWREAVTNALACSPFLGMFPVLDSAIEMAGKEQEYQAKKREAEALGLIVEPIDPMYARFALGMWKDTPPIIIPDVIMPRFEIEPLKLEDLIKPFNDESYNPA